MQDFIPGQRWINDAQLQMGLGSVLSTDFRTVTVIFLATGETFVYSKESVPLTRVQFAPGDQIITHEDMVLEVLAVEEHQGLIAYTGKDTAGDLHIVDESLLSNFIQLNRPKERLFNGQVDRDLWFELRYKTRQIQSQLASNPMHGLTGGRVSLIPHQLYIANIVANRYAPRVLLADEVGLGKTIEAGMIIHQQLVTERASRVLIVVPESLVHQWLVEMLRRFNLMFKIFDAERFDSLVDIDEHSGEPLPGQVNPFQTEQLVLCSLGFLSSRPEIFRQCRDSGWDLMVVDEAHHLQWSEQDPGFEYQLIDQLAGNTNGILLLTATPEQLGKSSHYARLRLLDPERFPSYSRFEEEERQYRPIADAVDALLKGQDLTQDIRKTLEKLLGHDEVASILPGTATPEPGSEAIAARQQIVEKLLDHHGTGRVLFRNTRSTVKGFPQRELVAYPVELPAQYVELLKIFRQGQFSDAQLLLCPELLFQVVNESEGAHWVKVDTRVGQLVSIVKASRPEKILVIAASADTVLDLAVYLKVNEGIDCAVFHEDLTMLERDRAAAWFADQVSGTQVMICSEIGSEGRNFQFLHNLVLFDLPLNPDLLEQRIGRLDRIGQQHNIRIHVPYLRDSAQEIMFHWYHDGLGAFENTCPTGYSVFEQVEDDLLEVLHIPGMDYADIIHRTRELGEHFTEILQNGRDRLPEYNSCRPLIAANLLEQAVVQDQESGLQEYMELVFDCLGIDYEIHSEGCYAINAGTHLLMPFPQLPEDGMTVTYDRQLALSYEDIDFLSWDHPLVRGAMDLVQASEFGNTAVVALPLAGVARGAFVMETIFVLESASTQDSHSSRYLPPTTIRVMIDQNGKRLDQLDSPGVLDAGGEKLKPVMIRKLIVMKEGLLRNMVRASEKFAQTLAPGVIEAAGEKSNAQLQGEIRRLEALQKINPNIRDQEIRFLQRQLEVINHKLSSASVRLDAMRVIVAT